MPRPLRLLLLLVFFAVLVRTAWLSDDALITLRSVLNVTHGFGLTFNIGERVQTFTHPLWALLLTLGYLVISNVYWATFAIAFTTSLVVFWLAIGRTASTAQAWLAVVVLLLSRAFIDFSTSGLENPLSNLLLVIFAWVALRPADNEQPRLITLWTLASLLYLTRPDNVLLVAPILVASTLRAGSVRAALKGLLVGLLPAAGWTLFSTVYYGFPFPNTAYAKLAHGVHPAEIRRQGLLYLVDSLDRDPITLTAIAFAVILGVTKRGVARGLAIGVALYLAYVVSIGGDFMAGRFMAVPLVASVLILAWVVELDRRVWIAASLVLGTVGLSSAKIPMMSDSRFDESLAKTAGVVDERAVYFRTQSVVLSNRGSFRNPPWPRATEAPQRRGVVTTCGLMGVSGLDMGPYVHLLDECALADPLLARMPSMFNSAWRVGHFRRTIPDGYLETLETDRTVIRDQSLSTFYEHLRNITRGPLFSRSRFADVWRMNTGAYDSLVNRRFYRHNALIVGLETMAVRLPEGTPIDATGVRRLELPLAVTTEVAPGRRSLEIALDSDDRYLVEFVRDNRIIASMPLGPIPAHRRQPGLATYSERLPVTASRAGFDTIIIAPVSGEQFAVGHVLIDSDGAEADAEPAPSAP